MSDNKTTKESRLHWPILGAQLSGAGIAFAVAPLIAPEHLHAFLPFTIGCIVAALVIRKLTMRENSTTKEYAPSKREMISLAHEQAEAGAQAIASGDYYAADIFLKLALDYLSDGFPELKET